MKRIILTAIALLSLLQTYTYGKGKRCNTQAHTASEIIKGGKFILEYQAFESHDTEGTATDTVRHSGDYIWFSSNGMAYMYFDGKQDSINYIFCNKDSVSFGDTPFRITDLGNGVYKLYQDEENPDGEYNRVIYVLKREEPS